VTKFTHDLAIKLHLCTVHVAGRRSEVYKAVPHGEATLARGVRYHSMYAGTALLLCHVIRLIWYSDLCKNARGCLETKRSGTRRMLFDGGSNRLLAFQ
jgi:hypothetical protein